MELGNKIIIFLMNKNNYSTKFELKYNKNKRKINLWCLKE